MVTPSIALADVSSMFNPRPRDDMIGDVPDIEVFTGLSARR